MARTILLDVLGSLVDISAPVTKLSARIGPVAARLNDLWRAKQLEYAWVATLTGYYEPFHTLTERALDTALRQCGELDAPYRDDLLAAYGDATAFPEVGQSLSRLRNAGHRLVAFSNADEAMLTSLLSAAGLTARLDLALSTEPSGCYKPDPSAYGFATHALKLSKSEAPVFLSSNPWDITGALRFGWEVVWVNRKGLPFEFAPGVSPRTVGSLEDLHDRLAVEPVR